MKLHPLRKFKTLWRRPDFRAHPIRAVWRRARWRAHWALSRSPLVVPVDRGLRMALIRTGSNTLVYYQGRSEPGLGDLIVRTLQPGMTFLDVGAHTGEYTLLAARAVGETGRVHAFEAQPMLCEAIRRNLALNGLERVVVHPLAVADEPGELWFQARHDPSVASLLLGGGEGQGERSRVPVTTLDAQAAAMGGRVDLIKMDIEGAEPLAFRGAAGLLDLPPDQAPAWVFEYSPANCRRLGQDAPAMLADLTRRGYQLHVVQDDGSLSPVNVGELGEAACNLYASKLE